jgi:flavin-dependent thymidylate synthase
MRTTGEQEAEIAAAREARHETRRPTVPALEEVLFEVRPVLDHGFIRVIDYMGDDAAIVQAARVSYGRGTKRVSEDRGLIRYLMRHHHTTPFEMCELKLHCKLPIFVARQWIRHRTACLAGDTVLSFDLPGAGPRGRRQHHRMTLEKLHRLWHEGLHVRQAKRKPCFVERIDPDRTYDIPTLARTVERREETLRAMIRDGYLDAERHQGRIHVAGRSWHAWAQTRPVVTVSLRERLAAMRLRSCDESTGAIQATRVVDVWETGVRPVFRVRLDNGYEIRMTKDHRCLTDHGWMTLEAATGLRLRDDGGVTWRADAPAFAVNGVSLHRSRDWLAAQRARGLGVDEMAMRDVGAGAPLAEFWSRNPGRETRPAAKTPPEPRRLWRAFSRVRRIEFAGEELTYDVAVAGPFHNFVANGFIVHNSVNEYSGRYSVLDREFYVPPPDSLGIQSMQNRQGRTKRLTAERAAEVLRLLHEDASRCYDHYQELLNEDDAGRPLREGEPGLARELARINLTLGYYTQWYWKIDLHNLFHFLMLRADPHAQEEIRAYALAIAEVVERWVPSAWEAFVDFRLEAMMLSRGEREAVRRLLAGERVDLAALGLSKREQDELRAKLGVTDTGR